MVPELWAALSPLAWGWSGTDRAAWITGERAARWHYKRESEREREKERKRKGDRERERKQKREIKTDSLTHTRALCLFFSLSDRAACVARSAAGVNTHRGLRSSF